MLDAEHKFHGVDFLACRATVYAGLSSVAHRVRRRLKYKNQIEGEVEI